MSGSEASAAVGQRNERMPASRRRRLVLVWAGLTGVLLCRLVWRGLAVVPDRTFARPIRIDPSTAGIPELMTLPGMGRSRAAAVVLYRVRHGPFPSADSLAAVDGIGPGMVGRWRPFLVEPAIPGGDGVGSAR